MRKSTVCRDSDNCKKEIQNAIRFVNGVKRERDIYTVAHFDLKG